MAGAAQVKPSMTDTERIDQLMVRRGVAESRSIAQRLIMAGQVRADGQLVVKPSQRVGRAADIQVDAGPRFVSRGGEKLAAALEAFPVTVQGAVCADVGASTGGFTDCLLQHGATRVYAIDSGRGQLHWKLRNDPRVVLMERTNARYLQSLPESVQLVTIDVSFISITILLAVVSGWMTPGGEMIALVKPQFEAGRDSVGRGGVVKDPSVHREVLLRAAAAAEETELTPRKIIHSPLRGPKGNLEFLLWCTKGGEQPAPADLLDELF